MSTVLFHFRWPVEPSLGLGGAKSVRPGTLPDAAESFLKSLVASTELGIIINFDGPNLRGPASTSFFANRLAAIQPVLAAG